MRRFSTAATAEKPDPISVVENVDLNPRRVIENARLTIAIGPVPGESIPLAKRETIVGREKDCDLRFDSDFISRHHCVFSLDNDTLRVRDLGSKNGTFLNGSRIHTDEVGLKHGDMLSIGDVIFEVCCDEFAERQPAAQPMPRSEQRTAVIQNETTQAHRGRFIGS